MKLNIVYNKNISDYKEPLSAVENLLIKEKVEFKTFELDSMEFFGEFTIVIGGDGTLLKAARFYSEKEIPVLGLNIGRLGFLSEQAHIETVIESVLNKNYHTDRKSVV